MTPGHIDQLALLDIYHVQCKSMERIVTTRLYGFAEHFKLLDKEQEGFRKFRGT